MDRILCNETDTLVVGADKLGDPAELVRGCEQCLLERITPLVRQQSVSLDLERVQRIDAAGIAALISLYRSAVESGHRFSISNASPRVAGILALVGLDRILMSQNAVRISHSEHRLEQTAA
jgi:anti-anti-sigma factor